MGQEGGFIGGLIPFKLSLVKKPTGQSRVNYLKLENTSKLCQTMF
jgi:hypothetical protein